MLFFVLPTPRADAAEKIRVATGGLAASSAAVWAALETKTFQKYGLEPEYIIIDNGTVAGQALLAGELQYLISTGALAISANQKGGDLTIIGGIINFIPFQLIGRPEIKNAEDLRGKKVAISRFGSASDFAAREALKKLRLDPAKDTVILQVGGQSARFAALAQNGVQAAVFNEPLSTLTVTKHKMNLLADLANLDLPFPNTDYIVRREHLQSHRAQVVNFMKTILEGMRALKSNRALGIRAIQKYLKMNNPEEAGIAYDYYIGQKMGEIPDVPSRAALMAGIEQTVGKKDGLTPDSLKLADRSVLEELIKSGFVTALYK
ncbi:MAG TPA: ABC transporter substrate-binding protein [Terriglobales bacterium]|nr:ABC transporter substrate-binding protein [Terriglobales bacterium]